MAFEEFLDAVRRARGAGFNGFLVKETLDVSRESVRSFGAAAAFFFEGFPGDPVEAAGEGAAELFEVDAALGGDAGERGIAAEAGAGAGWFDLFNEAEHLVESSVFELLAFERGGAGEELLQHHAERIDIGAGVDVEVVVLGLFGARVKRRADLTPWPVKIDASVSGWCSALARPKSMTFGTGLPS